MYSPNLKKPDYMRPSNNKHDWTPVKYLPEYFASQQNAKAVATLFSYYIAKILPTSYFG